MKKKLALALAALLLCTLAVGTTLTYFTDTDYDKNVMTVGKVEIEQVEAFDEANANLLPYTGVITPGAALDVAKNAITKTVVVKNTGSEAAYIRTLIAFEAVNGEDPIAKGIIHAQYNDATVGAWAYVNKIEVGGVTYFVYSFTYTGPLAKNTESAPSLVAIALDGAQGNAFSDAIVGKYDVLVLSQAVQAAGFGSAADAFAAAFPYGDGNAAIEGWFTAAQN